MYVQCTSLRFLRDIAYFDRVYYCAQEVLFGRNWHGKMENGATIAALYTSPANVTRLPKLRPVIRRVNVTASRHMMESRVCNVEISRQTKEEMFPHTRYEDATPVQREEIDDPFGWLHLLSR